MIVYVKPKTICCPLWSDHQPKLSQQSPLSQPANFAGSQCLVTNMTDVKVPYMCFMFFLVIIILNPEYLGVTNLPTILCLIDLQKPGCSNLIFLFASRNIEKDPVCKKCSNNLKTYGQVIKTLECKNTFEFKTNVSYK